MTPRFALKAATDDLHAELDGRLSRLNLANEDDYRRFLRFHGRTVPSVEENLADGGLDELIPGWSGWRRTPAIMADLAALGEPVPALSGLPKNNSRAELLGTAYVLEGSRLGGRILRKRVGNQLPVSFLDQTGSNEAWPALIAVLDRSLYSESLLKDAKAAARRCFTLFLDVAREARL